MTDPPELHYETDPDAQDGDERRAATGVDVPLEALSADALRGVVESFVNREGTDYGAVERSLDSKVADVVRQLERGEAKIVFDPESESIDIVPTRAEGGRR